MTDDQFLQLFVSNAPQEADLRFNNTLPRLIEIGRVSGFRNIINRKVIWPLLLELNLEKLQQEALENAINNPKKLEHSEDYDQLRKDAMRSFFSFKNFQDLDQHYLKKKQEQLLQLLDMFSLNQPNFKYFQGFHDVATIFIALFGNKIAYHMSHKIATTYLRDPFLFKFQDTVSILDYLIYDIILIKDNDFQQIFEQFEDHKLSFTMPWIITWFAHSFEEIDIIVRIWDYLISSKASAIVYLSAALILSTKESLKQYLIKMEMGYDMGIIHSFYQNLRHCKLDIQNVIRLAIELEDSIKLEGLPSYPKLHSETVIREDNFLKQSKVHQEIKKINNTRNKRKKIIFAIALGALTMAYIFSSKQAVQGL